MELNKRAARQAETITPKTNRRIVNKKQTDVKINIDIERETDRLREGRAQRGADDRHADRQTDFTPSLLS